MLIAMAVYDTRENKRTRMTERTLASLEKKVDLTRDRIIVVNNASCPETGDVLGYYKDRGVISQLITLLENEGTARAINKAWAFRERNEHCVKMDNDVVISRENWPFYLEEVFGRDPTIGICGLKRTDCLETPWQSNPWFRSRLHMLDHQPGQPWIVVEEVNHVMGTCQAYSSELLDTIGFLFQMGGLYGFDDALASVRAHVAGYRTVFIPDIRIEHIDPGDTPYQQWKEEYSSRLMTEYHAWKAYFEQTGLVYCGPEGVIDTDV